MALSSPLTRKAEVYRLRFPAILLVPLFALVLQAYLPLYFDFITLLDLPLLVVIYFALTRRSPVGGLLGGALIGMAQDSLSRGPIGLYGTAKTVVGYISSSASVQVDTERSGVRLVIIFLFYCLQVALLYLVGTLLLRRPAELTLSRSLLAALVNALGGVILFKLLDRFRERA